MKGFDLEFKSRAVVAAATCLIAATSSLSLADDDVWKIAESNSWSRGLSWVDGSTPNSIVDDATISPAGVYTISFGANPSAIGDLAVSGGANVTFASTSRPPNPDVPRTMHLDDSHPFRDGSLVVQSSSSLTLGASNGVPFHLTADGAAGVSGTLNLNFGSTVTAESMTLTAGSSGGVNITGSGLFTEGLSVRAGGLAITGGGVVQTSSAFVGQADGEGSVNVTGPGSQWTNDGPLSVGNFGRGTLNISDGAEVQTTGLAVLGAESGFGPEPDRGVVNVGGSNSTWTAGRLLIGQRGTGSLTVTGGARVATGSANIGDRNFSTGTATVAGAGSTWTVNGFLGVGGDAFFRQDGGTGTLRIQSGGTVAGMLETVVFDGGQLSVEGGTLSTANFGFSAGATSQGNFNWTAGTLHVRVFAGDLVNQGGVLAPLGISAGSTEIFGDYIQLDDAALQIRIGGTAPGTQHDLVSISSNAFLGGNLQLAVLNGFVPSAADTFTVAQVMGALAGSFANVANGQRLVTGDGLGSFLVHYGANSGFDPNQVVLSAFQRVGGVTGDFDFDGDVDGADFLKWQRGGSPNPNTATDLAAWRGNFGFSSLTVAGASIPEPRAEVLALSLTLFACLSQRKPV